MSSKMVIFLRVTLGGRSRSSVKSSDEENVE